MQREEKYVHSNRTISLLFVFLKWEPMGGAIWNIESSAGRYVMCGLYTVVWLIVLAATFLINHFDLFGLRQVWLNLRRQRYTGLLFRTPGFQWIVRHPLYVGWLLVFWPAPRMTVAHLVFAAVTTLYVVVAIQFEERDLMRSPDVDTHGVHPEFEQFAHGWRTRTGSGRRGWIVKFECGRKCRRRCFRCHHRASICTLSRPGLDGLRSACPAAGIALPFRPL